MCHCPEKLRDCGLRTIAHCQPIDTLMLFQQVIQDLGRTRDILARIFFFGAFEAIQQGTRRSLYQRKKG